LDWGKFPKGRRRNREVAGGGFYRAAWLGFGEMDGWRNRCLGYMEGIQGQRPWGLVRARVASPAPRRCHPSVREEEEKQTRAADVRGPPVSGRDGVVDGKQAVGPKAQVGHESSGAKVDSGEGLRGSSEL
jgi:hypothetical protein